LVIKSNKIINNYVFSPTKHTHNRQEGAIIVLSALIMPLIAGAFLSSIEFQITESFAKSCVNENIGNDVTSSCGSQGLSYLWLSSSGNDVKSTTGNNLKTFVNSNSNSEGSSKGKNSESPFILPFP
jgi:hypothetical protein